MFNLFFIFIGKDAETIIGPSAGNPCDGMMRQDIRDAAQFGKAYDSIFGRISRISTKVC